MACSLPGYHTGSHAGASLQIVFGTQQNEPILRTLLKAIPGRTGRHCITAL
ncbi:MAG: hypothetical protein AB1758_28050 [Candidatus Eremiobacterota bacterium]